LVGKCLMHALAMGFGALVVFAPTDQAASFVLMSCSPGQFAGKPAEPNGLTVACGGSFNLCGYVDQSKNQVIPWRFEVALPFSDGFAGVRINGKFGFIDRAGKLVVPAKFDVVAGFTKGLAEVVLDGKAGVIDRLGNFVVEPNYARAMPFGEDTVLVSEGAWQAAGFNGCESLRDAKRTLQLEFVKNPSPQYRLWHVRTRSLSSEIYRLRYFDDPDHLLLWASTEDNNLGEFGLLRSDGTWQITPRYEDVSPLTDGFATVCNIKPTPSDPSKRKVCGAVDSKGDLVVPIKFDGTFYWRNGLKLVRNDDKKGIVDISGQLLGSRYFDDARLAEKGDVSIVRIGDQWVGLDRRGQIVANPEDGEILSQCPSGIKVEKRSGKFRFVDANGKPTESYLFEQAFLKLDCDRPTPVTLNGQWGFVDTGGHLLMSKPSFDNVYNFQDGYAAVEEGGKWGVIDAKGRYSAAPQFDNLRPDDDGVFVIDVDGRKSWVNAQGQQVPEPTRKKDRAAVLACGEDGGHFFSTDTTGQTLWGLAAADGTVFVPPKYRALRCYANGLAWVADDMRRMWCQIDTQGVIRNPAECSPNFNGRIIFDASFEKFSDDRYESSVLWERALLDYGRGVRKAPPKIVGSGF